MMQIIAVGRLKPGPEHALLQRYQVRIRPTLRVKEVAETRISSHDTRSREARVLLAACPKSAFVVALDEGGRELDSHAFSSYLADWLQTGREVCFVIGGAEGLTSDVIEHADFVLSLGRMTWPHILARALLVEQIYRARSISEGHPYHRASRPRD